jgi:hypothetical protein
MRSEILNELIKKQLPNVPYGKKLSYSDLERLVKYIDTSVFHKKKCCLWSGYVTNSNVEKKKHYINFYFRKKKTALHRILYLNYVDVSCADGYISFSCKNKGHCCNVTHMKFNKYNNANCKNQKNDDNESNSDSDNSNDNSDNKSSQSQEDYVVDFDPF